MLLCSVAADDEGMEPLPEGIEPYFDALGVGLLRLLVDAALEFDMPIPRAPRRPNLLLPEDEFCEVSGSRLEVVDDGCSPPKLPLRAPPALPPP